MKKQIALFLLLVFIFFFSCTKKKALNDILYSDLTGDIIYTDSFIPHEWEEPLKRKRITPVDKDIDFFISKDVTDPNLREMLSVIENFFKLFKEGNISDMQTLLNSSAFNSFRLRSQDIIIRENYILRVAYPSFLLPVKKSSDQTSDAVQSSRKDSLEKLWIDFKLIFESASIKSSLELQRLENKYIITDFDNQFFSDLKNIKGFTKKSGN